MPKSQETSGFLATGALPAPDRAKLKTLIKILSEPLNGKQFPKLARSKQIERAQSKLTDDLHHELTGERRPDPSLTPIQNTSYELARGLVWLKGSLILDAFDDLEMATAALPAGTAARLFDLGISSLTKAINEVDDHPQRRALREDCAQALRESMRKGTLEAPVALVTFGRDDSCPLPHLAQRLPLAKQALDREAGTIVITFPHAHGAKPRRTVLRFTPCPPGATALQALQQDEQIARLDRILQPAQSSNVGISDPMPPEIGISGQDLRIGRLVVARTSLEGDAPDRGAVLHALQRLEPPCQKRSSAPVHQWPRPIYRLPKVSRLGPDDRQLRLVVQLEEDPIIKRNAAAQRYRYPTQTVLVQADTLGAQRVLRGSPLLKQWTPGLTIKVELHGHGGRHGRSDQCALAGYSAKALAERLETVLGKLNCPARIDAVNLTSCALESPVFPRSFAAEFLAEAHARRILQPHATVTVYADCIGFNLDRRTGEKLGSRVSQHFRDQPLGVHLPGKTWVYTRDPASGEILRRDKYGQARTDEPPRADAADEGPQVSPWQPLPPLFPR